ALAGQPVEHPDGLLIEQNRPFFARIMRRLEIPDGGWCLDIGCGNGWTIGTLAQLGYRVAGFDITPASLATARRTLPGADLAELDYYDAGAQYARDDRTFEFMICRCLGIAQKLLDWTEPAWLDATRRLGERLAPNGVLYWVQLTTRKGE